MTDLQQDERGQEPPEREGRMDATLERGRAADRAPRLGEISNPS